MLTLDNYHDKILQETGRLQTIEIPIPGAGQNVSFETETLTGMKDIVGIVLINPDPLTVGHGTLRLRVGDEEIFPGEFHADLITMFSQRYVSSRMEFPFKEYVFPVRIRAQGRPVKISYLEPAEGGKGSLFLYLLGNSNGNFCIPGYRFHVIGINVPKGSNAKDTEIPISEKTLQSHKKITGAMFYGISNRLKQVKLYVDESTLFPEGMQGQLVTKDMVTPSSIAGGIFTKHIIPFRQLMHPVNLDVKSSTIEGRIWATPHPDNDYKIFLYLLATL